MAQEKEKLLLDAINKSIEDNARAARKNKAKALATGENLIDPLVSKRFINFVRQYQK